MRRKLIIGLVVLNGLFGAALFSQPAESKIRALVLRNCCKTEGSEAFCCEMCCWVQPNCNSDDDCEDR
jgi:hypothetical protein